MGPITSWKVDGEPMETVTDFILGGSKITADGDCSHEIKRCLLLERKAVTNLDSVLKSTLGSEILPKGEPFPENSEYKAFPKGTDLKQSVGEAET